MKEKRLWDAIQEIKNPDIRYEMEFRYLLKYGKVISVSSLENELKTITR